MTVSPMPRSDFMLQSMLLWKKPLDFINKSVFTSKKLGIICVVSKVEGGLDTILTKKQN